MKLVVVHKNAIKQIKQALPNYSDWSIKSHLDTISQLSQHNILYQGEQYACVNVIVGILKSKVSINRTKAIPLKDLHDELYKTLRRHKISGPPPVAIRMVRSLLADDLGKRSIILNIDRYLGKGVS